METLHEACSNGSLDDIRALLKTVDVNELNEVRMPFTICTSSVNRQQ